MGETASSVFIHSCLKMPVQPRVRQCKNSGDRGFRPKGRRSATPTHNGSIHSVASYLEFYSNIPDYSDLHDLSSSEFYAKLRDIKATQKHFMSTSLHDDSNSAERPSSQSSIGSKFVHRKPEGRRKKFMDVSIVKPHFETADRKPSTIKPPPKIVLTKDYSVRSESPAKRASPDRGSSLLESSWGKSDLQGLKTDGGCDEDFRSCETPPCHHRHHHHHHHFCDNMAALSLDSSGINLHGHRPRSKSRSKTSHEVPLLSRIPLFDRIMAEQEERRRINHERNSKELRALVQPFSFTKREEEEKQALHHSRSCSSIELQVQPCPGSSHFRARPVPKNLFSDNAHERMREDQFYRALRKRIRADEMLKCSALPPSMEAREKLHKVKSKSLDCLEGRANRRHRSRSRSRAYRQAQDCISGEVRIAKCGKPGKSAWLGDKVRPSSTTDSSADCSPNASTIETRPRPRPHSALSVSRSNLASVLRVQTSRKRIEKAMKDRIAEREHQEQVKFKTRLLRLSPAWRQLDYSTEEDLSLRLAQRKQEARQRGVRHRQLMNDIYSRVHQIPPLFQDPERRYNYHHSDNKANSHAHGSRTKSLENSLEQMGREGNPHEHCNARKVKSFYIDRSNVHTKSSESSQIKSDGSKDDYSASESE